MNDERAREVGGMITRQVQRYSLNPTDRDDLIQNCVLAVIEYESTSGKTASAAYIAGIVRNHFKRFAESRRRNAVTGYSESRDAKLSGHHESETVGRPIVTSLDREKHGDPCVNRAVLSLSHSGTTEASVAAMKAEAHDRRQSYLQLLTDSDRAILEMKLSGHTPAEIAEARGLSLSAVHKALKRVKSRVVYLPE